MPIERAARDGEAWRLLAVHLIGAMGATERGLALCQSVADDTADLLCGNVEDTDRSLAALAKLATVCGACRACPRGRNEAEPVTMAPPPFRWKPRRT